MDRGFSFQLWHLPGLCGLPVNKEKNIQNGPHEARGHWPDIQSSTPPPFYFPFVEAPPDRKKKTNKIWKKIYLPNRSS